MPKRLRERHSDEPRTDLGLHIRRRALCSSERTEAAAQLSGAASLESPPTHSLPQEGEDRGFNPNAPAVHNTELKLLIGQLKERFIKDLQRIEGALADIVANGNDATHSTSTSQPLLPSLLSVNNDAVCGGALLLSENGAVTSAGGEGLIDGAARPANSSSDGCDDGGLLLTADMLFGTATEEALQGHTAQLTSHSDALDPPLDVLVSKIQSGLRSRAKAMVLIDMVLQLQQERNEMLRMRAHMLRVLESAEGILREEAGVTSAADNV